MCLYPQLVKNPKYTETKKNGGQVPAVNDPRVLYVPIGCNDCIECRKQKAREWQIRLQEDIKRNRSGKFITLTFSTKSILKLIAENEQIRKATGYNIDNALATRAVRLFLERHRKKYKKSLRHWLVTELGQTGTEHIHLHGIIWTNTDLTEIEKIWSYGYVWKGKEIKDKITSKPKIINYVSNRTVNYIIKYITKKDEKHTYYKPIVLTTPGIGKGYETTYDGTKNAYQPRATNETYRTNTGHRISLPIYYRNKIYTDEQKETLWLEKLDKNERWICGERIPFKTKSEIKNYFATLKYYQEKNKKLGYGDGKKTWEEYKYQKEMRELKYKERGM